MRSVLTLFWKEEVGCFFTSVSEHFIQYPYHFKVQVTILRHLEADISFVKVIDINIIYRMTYARVLLCVLTQYWQRVYRRLEGPEGCDFQALVYSTGCGQR